VSAESNRARRRPAWSPVLALAGLLVAGAAAAEITAPAAIGYSVVATYPHDKNAFTQGLVYVGGALYESTGLYGRSSLRRVDLNSGRPEAIRTLDARYFGEGLTAFGDRLIQLTWRSGTGFVYARRDLSPLGQFRYPTEGWGLTQDGKNLIMSDGSATLYFLDPDRFTEVRRIQVRDHRGPVKLLNELEFVGGVIFANVWQSPRIVRIDADSGRVTGTIDLSALANRMRRDPSTDVLNGIAYIPGSGRLLITGKLWPSLYAIKLLDAQ
jgi:glutaminyl-peptide cyclotransferase